MNTRRCAPAARASSTAYWISGLSTTGSISLGLALVAGRKRVPRPATGNTAVRIGDFAGVLMRELRSPVRAGRAAQGHDARPRSVKAGVARFTVRRRARDFQER